MELVKKFLERGKLISPEIAEMGSLSDEDIENLSDSDPFVLKKQDLKKLKIPKPEIIKIKNEKKEYLHVSDYTNFYLERYNFLKEEIMKKLDEEEISSVNKLSGGSSSVIGMVRDIDEGTVTLEDNTGSLKLNTDKKLLKDEVVGVKGNVIANKEIRMHPKKFFFPDVPLRKKINTTEESHRALFISQANEKSKQVIEEESPDYVFISAEVDEVPDIPGGSRVVCVGEKNLADGKIIGEDPVWIGLGEIKILLHSGEAVEKAKSKLSMDQAHAMIALLKKRHLAPYRIHSLKDRYLLKDIPDLIHVDGEPTMANYKGVTLLSTSSERAYLVDFKTREVEEIDLQK